jgi:hypothetical protein
MRYDELRHRPDVVKLQVQSKAHVDTRLPSREGGNEGSFQCVSEDRPEIDSFRTKNVD